MSVVGALIEIPTMLSLVKTADLFRRRLYKGTYDKKVRWPRFALHLTEQIRRLVLCVLLLSLPSTLYPLFFFSHYFVLVLVLGSHTHRPPPSLPIYTTTAIGAAAGGGVQGGGAPF